ncbi:META domain-containing protein [uncultured Draconibacterium sp.]|mgnify:CR=1 FL=1|uniref:META domain-containing protein n=1 Tax=uncultured Draconibacterium sp. TaxID=1573823 RepID=UPI0025DA178C|nr:META domain-containing protein [uncultured Draconibacterium sp.]
MKRAKLILVFFVASLLFSACDDDCNCDSKLVGQWEVDDFMSVESAVYPKDDNYNPLIEFNGDGSYNIALDVNICGGDYSLNSTDSISISGAGCTKICCDSEFSKKIATMLPQVSAYTVDGDELRLSVDGWGWMNLTRVSE